MQSNEKKQAKNYAFPRRAWERDSPKLQHNKQAKKQLTTKVNKHTKSKL